VSVAELPTGIADSLSDAVKQLSFLYDSVVHTATVAEDDDQLTQYTSEEINHEIECTDQFLNGRAEPFEYSTTG
jgi:hypothetical protein